MTTATDTDTKVDVHQGQEDKCQVHWRHADGTLQFACGAPASFLVRTHNGANLRNISHEERTDVMCDRCFNEVMLLVCELHDNTPVVISYSRIK